MFREVPLENDDPLEVGSEQSVSSSSLSADEVARIRVQEWRTEQAKLKLEKYPSESAEGKGLRNIERLRGRLTLPDDETIKK